MRLVLKGPRELLSSPEQPDEHAPDTVRIILKLKKKLSCDSDRAVTRSGRMYHLRISACGALLNSGFETPVVLQPFSIVLGLISSIVESLVTEPEQIFIYEVKTYRPGGLDIHGVTIVMQS